MSPGLVFREQRLTACLGGRQMVMVQYINIKDKEC